jgi:two-component sensor histidine kinase
MCKEGAPGLPSPVDGKDSLKLLGNRAMTGEKGDDPIVEPAPSESEIPVLSRALAKRIRQQEILAELGVTALQGAEFERLIQDAARLTAEGMQAEFCKVLEHIPGENRLLVRAGVGWGPDIVGKATVGADLDSPAGFALRTGRPVISNHLENEERFRTPDLLVQYGIHRAINVILQGDGKPFGVLEVDSRSEEEFTTQDLAFLQGAANVLGTAIERGRQERSLKAALARQEVLVSEIGHRVKNSLAIVASMLQLQVSRLSDPEVTQHLEEAVHRISAIAKAHERILDQRKGSDTIDLGVYLDDVCRDLNAAVAPTRIEIDAETGIAVTIDRAIPIALITNELITNAAKYAYQGRTGLITVRLARGPQATVELFVRDEGVGLPPGFDLDASGLGLRIVQAFKRQLNAEIAVRRLERGTEFVLSIPGENS